MRERELVVRLRLPASIRTRWLVVAAGALVCFSAIAYAALTTFASGQTLLASDLTNNFNKITAHTHPMSVSVTPQVPVGLSSSTVTVACAACPAGSVAIGGSCRITPFPGGCDTASVSLSGQGVDIVYAGGVATNNNRYCCRAQPTSATSCNLGAWAVCVSPSSVAGVDSQQTFSTTTASY